MPFAVAGAAITAGAGLAGGMMQSGAVSSASKAAQQDQRIAYLVAQEQLRPYREGGLQAYDEASRLMGLRGQPEADAALARFRTDPGYQFMMGQGIDQIQSAQNAQHILDSGDTTKATLRYAEGLADQSFGSYINRLFGLAQAGQNSATQSATQGLQTASNLGNIAMGAAGAQNAITGNMMSNIGNSVNSLLSNKGFMDWLGGPSPSTYGTSALGTPGISASGNPVMTGYAPAMTPGQVGVGGFVAPMAPSQGY